VGCQEAETDRKSWSQFRCRNRNRNSVGWRWVDEGDDINDDYNNDVCIDFGVMMILL